MDMLVIGNFDRKYWKHSFSYKGTKTSINQATIQILKIRFVFDAFKRNPNLKLLFHGIAYLIIDESPVYYCSTEVVCCLAILSATKAYLLPETIL
mmetsp:Transcript_12025/g.28520  ORF Transcript_12025/g.28520 Transcript_12025/m.28520 type:complete len:95 (+) Transcript_12025:856-1140(+)